MDERSITFEKSLKIGDEYERRTKLMILRAAMLRAHITVVRVSDIKIITLNSVIMKVLIN